MSTLQRDLRALLDLLHESHALYEQTDLGGQSDDEWATWYAEQLLEHPLAQQLSLPPNRQQMASWLEEQFELSTGTVVPWTEFLVGRLMESSRPPGNGSGDEESSP